MLMPGQLLEIPAIQPLRRVSPSRYLSLKECPLREIWNSSRQQVLLPNSPAARLGTVIHRLLETAGKGVLERTNATEIQKVWAQLVNKTEQEMQLSWLERSLIPLSQSVAQYEVRKIRACKKAEQIAVAGRRSTSVAKGASTHKFESWLETRDGLVGGSIDEIQETLKGSVLRDYKSGQIMERGVGTAAAEVDEKYKLQLKCYAALFAIKYDCWPIRLEVVPLQGSEIEIPFKPSECEALLRTAVSTLTELNNRIALALSSSEEIKIVEFANPSPTNCRNCLFRPGCKPYQAAQNLSENVDWPRDVWGSVAEFKLLGNQRLSLILNRAGSGSRVIRVRGLTATTDRHPAIEFIREGDEVALFNLKGNVEREEFSETQSTVVYIISLPPT